LENIVMAKLAQAPKGGRGKTLNFQGTRLLTGSCIKHLHPHLRFFIGEVDSELPLSIGSLTLFPVFVQIDSTDQISSKSE
jgi:hypothetical protein